MAARPSRSYHHGDLRRALLREATAVLRAHGAEALSLRELARRLGVTPAAPYAHFPDKAALLAALSEAGFRTLGEALRRASGSAPSQPVQRLKAVAREYVAFALDHPAQFQLMFGAERPRVDQHEHLHRTAHEARGVVLDAVVDCQRAGHLRAGDPMELALFLWVVMHGVAVLVLADFMPGVGSRRHRRADAARLVAECFDRVLAGLAPGTAEVPARRPAASPGSASRQTEGRTR